MDSIVVTDVRANPGDSAFLVENGDVAILYDSGFGFTGYEVAENIKSKLGPRALNYIFLTHSHYDHVLGSVYVSEYWPQAKVVASEYAARIFAKPSAKAVMRNLDQKFAKKCGINTYDDLIDRLKTDITVKNCDIINAGNLKFKVIELPGHTKCSVGYYCPEHKLLLGSETIGVYNGCDDVVPSYLVSCEKAIASIDSLSSYDIEHILVPHYGLVSGTEAENYLLKARQRAVSTAETIASMHQQGIAKSEIMQWFKEEFYKGYIKEIYPVDAMELNTGIMIDLVIKENSI